MTARTRVAPTKQQEAAAAGWRGRRIALIVSAALVVFVVAVFGLDLLGYSKLPVKAF